MGEETGLPLLSATGASGWAPVIGIPEWMCYYANYGVQCPGPEAIDECIDAHTAMGMGILAWNCGRSTLDYWSDLPRSTAMCERGCVVGGLSWEFVRSVMTQVCPLRRALELCHDRGMTLLGRLSMNRHYGGAEYEGVTSHFAADHPEYHEVSKLGNPVSGSLCYALAPVRQERIDILLEVQRIGVDGLVLDFCRQMPMLMYHEALVGPYMSRSGIDPRTIDGPNPPPYMDWFHYRCDVLTEFMAKLRNEVRQQERSLGKPCPIIARVPDSAPWLMIAYGLDVERWCSDDLVDATLLSPFPRTVEDLDSYPEYHCRVCRRHGKPCIGGIGSLKLIENDVTHNTGFYHPQPVFAMANRQYEAGVEAMSLYQSETLVRMDYLSDLLRVVGRPRVVADRASSLPRPELPDDYPIGKDWHSQPAGREGLRTARAGDSAL